MLRKALSCAAVVSVLGIIGVPAASASTSTRLEQVGGSASETPSQFLAANHVVPLNTAVGACLPLVTCTVSFISSVGNVKGTMTGPGGPSSSSGRCVAPYITCSWDLIGTSTATIDEYLISGNDISVIEVL